MSETGNLDAIFKENFVDRYVVSPSCVELAFSSPAHLPGPLLFLVIR